MYRKVKKKKECLILEKKNNMTKNKLNSDYTAMKKKINLSSNLKCVIKK
jgi:hypothetical protein